jgi:hypothetical protein
MAQKHFLFFDDAGIIIGYAPGHWISPDWNNTMPPTDPSAQPEEGNGVSIGGIELLCSCPEYDATCLCAIDGVNNHYVEDPEGTPVLTEKPPVTILVDNSPHPVNDPALINKPPGSWVNLKLEANIPDGHQIAFIKSDALLSTDDITLTFNNGSTESVLLKAPAQGLVGRIGGTSKYVSPVVVSILGWA